MQNHRTIVALALSMGTLMLIGFQAGAQRLPQSGTPGEYRLTELAGRPLPAVLEEEEGCREELLSATLTLEPNGRWILRTAEREHCGDLVEQDDETEQGT